VLLESVMYASMREKIWLVHVRNTSCKHYIILTSLLLSSMVYLNAPRLSWAAVYQCSGAAGEPILTNRPARLHDCQMLIEEITPDLTPPVAPMPSNQHTDHEASIGSPPAENLGALSSPLPPPPCPRGVNPVNNTLSASPCVRSDQSEAQPSEATPHRLLLKPVSR
jgi:hypothetical protein